MHDAAAATAPAVMVNANRLWHKQGVMAPRTGHRPRPPLDQAALNELALSYVGRFATSRARLVVYLERKLREQGSAEEARPDPAATADLMVRRGYVDDVAFAQAKARAMSARGYGVGRVRQALRHAGIDEEAGATAWTIDGEDQQAAALRLARRRRLGPFAPEPPDRTQRDKAIATMLRAGHPLNLARKIVETPPGGEVIW